MIGSGDGEIGLRQVFCPVKPKTKHSTLGFTPGCANPGTHYVDRVCGWWCVAFNAVGNELEGAGGFVRFLGAGISSFPSTALLALIPPNTHPTIC